MSIYNAVIALSVFTLYIYIYVMLIRSGCFGYRRMHYGCVFVPM